MRYALFDWKIIIFMNERKESDTSAEKWKKNNKKKTIQKSTSVDDDRKPYIHAKVKDIVVNAEADAVVNPSDDDSEFEDKKSPIRLKSKLRGSLTTSENVEEKHLEVSEALRDSKIALEKKRRGEVQYVKRQQHDANDGDALPDVSSIQEPCTVSDAFSVASRFPEKKRNQTPALIGEPLGKKSKVDDNEQSGEDEDLSSSENSSRHELQSSFKWIALVGTVAILGLLVLKSMKRK
uniref:Uncharacterized protein n=1 Tax=Proboscia inermis TaxID=420281 RepID=A0A7S0C9F8_9STRA|mmetsp:Transcript_320/g.325  ORF Transcript_320/g.325 Transcript_320/m.325 type:complete len:236 (+) Transcript_320:199-906(+)